MDPSSLVLPDPSLSDLVVDVDHQREWYSSSPPRKPHWPGARHRVGKSDINQKGAQNRFKEQRVVHKRVCHSLLEQRTDPRLTNHQIRPLHDDNRDKVRSVRSRQCFDSRSSLHREQ